MRELSAGAVVYRKEGDEIKFLLLKYPSYWGFVKGNIEEKESVKETVIRELEEETGIKDGILIDGFKEENKYTYKREGKLVFKIVIFLLLETKTEEIKISFEHEDFKWCEFEEALKLVVHKNSKDLLEKALKFIAK